MDQVHTEAILLKGLWPGEQAKGFSRKISESNSVMGGSQVVLLKIKV